MEANAPQISGNQSSVQTNTVDLSKHQNLLVKQRHEIAEFFGFESRNKYQVSDAQGQPILFAAEQSKGFFGFLMRYFLGHWRTFEVFFFNPQRHLVFQAKHPFRFYFKRFEIYDASGRFLGALQKRFSIFSKRFDVEDHRGMAIMEVSSPIWKIWTFPFKQNGKEVASIKKKWSGIFSEAFTDKDNFMVEFTEQNLRNEERQVIVAAAIFVDMMYFEKKAS